MAYRNDFTVPFRQFHIDVFEMEVHVEFGYSTPNGNFCDDLCVHDVYLISPKEHFCELTKSMTNHVPCEPYIDKLIKDWFETTEGRSALLEAANNQDLAA